MAPGPGARLCRSNLRTEVELSLQMELILTHQPFREGTARIHIDALPSFIADVGIPWLTTAKVMELPILGQVIAERKYVLSTALGSKEEIVVRLGAPQQSLDRSDFFCPFEIVGFGTTKIKCGFGIDAFQALRLTMKMIGLELHFFRQRYGMGFYLSEQSDDLGFPEEAWTEGLGHQIVKAFAPVCGLKLSIARNAGSMKNFQFGAITVHPRGKGTVGQYALHIQCPWRLVVAQCAWRVSTKNLIVTGAGDWWEPAERSDNFDWDEWNEHRVIPSLQQKELAELFEEYDDATKSWINISDELVVQEVESDDYGGLDIHLSGGYRLQAFPEGKSGEQWRLFQPSDKAPHFVMENGILRGAQLDESSNGNESN
jgi:hypothetical protein